MSLVNVELNTDVSEIFSVTIIEIDAANDRTSLVYVHLSVQWVAHSVGLLYCRKAKSSVEPKNCKLICALVNMTFFFILLLTSDRLFKILIIMDLCT
jgi:hypothetical protein